MNNRDLTIGNYYFLSGEIFQLTEESFENVIIFKTKDRLKPIPFTEDLLEDLDFSEKKFDDGIYGWALGQFAYINSGQIRMYQDGILLEKEIKYLHQFQDIYYFFTDKELTLKESK